MDWDKQDADRTKIHLKVALPPDFPPKYVKPVGRAVDQCQVARLARGIRAESFEQTVFIPEGPDGP